MEEKNKTEMELREKIRQEVMAEITEKVNQRLDERFVEFANADEKDMIYTHLLALGYAAAYQEIDLLPEKTAHDYLMHIQEIHELR